MPDTLESILHDHCNLDKEKPILVGVSGGPDSLCLLSLLQESGWRVAAAHFNHMLRPEAAQEAAAVEAIAGRLGIPYVGGGGDVRQYAADNRLSIESAARDLRYRFLFEQARDHRAQAVAVGHTADDQVETVLMHFIRGAGLNGLRGMAYRTMLPEYDVQVPLVRPLLDFWRSETIAYCASHALQAHYDASNESLDFLRNRVRHQLIPELKAYNPRFREAVWRSSKTLSADYDLLNTIIEPIWQQALVLQSNRCVSLSLGVLLGQPVPVLVHLLRHVAQLLIPSHETSYADLQRAAAFITDAEADRSDFTGGLLLRREADTLYIAGAEASLPFDQWPQMSSATHSVSFSVPCCLALAQGWQFTAEERELTALELSEPWDGTDSFRAFLDMGKLPGQLELRVRRAGDRLELLGLSGHSQKLSDFFINVKLPARARENWPILCAGGEVIWVPGYRPAEPYRLHAGSTRVLCLAVLPPR